MTTSSIHEMLSTELTKLGVFDLDKNQFTSWSEEKSHKTMLPGRFCPPPPPQFFGQIDMSKHEETV